MWSTLTRFAIVLTSVVLNVSQLNYSNSNFNILSRIVGGKPITINESPWQGALLFGDHFFCGGTIISKNWILTAAHCIFADVAFTVRVGSKYYQKNGQIRKVKRVILNSRYNSKTMEHDIALILIESAFKFNTDVKPIRLAKFKRNLPQKFVVSGWGLINETLTSPACSLKAATIFPVTQSNCEKNYKKGSITKNMICAAAPKKDACTGDSGGPLFFEGIQYGIVSFGVGCGREMYPGVYTDVRRKNTWIKKVILKYGGSMPIFE
uniref:trypsin n=1 Tax=Glossina brevipalpis TaxID=37001 RepID=A0A1A9WG48_9MUSC